MELSSSRQMGMGTGPIPWIAIYHYCDAIDVQGEQREDVFYFVRHLDNRYLKFMKDNSRANT